MGAQSLLERLNGFGVIGKSRFKDNFDADSLDTERWTFTDLQGTGTSAMSDTLDGGYTIDPGSSNNDFSELSFNDIRQYSNTASITIFQIKTDSLDAFQAAGLTELKNDGSNTVIRYSWSDVTTFFRLRTAVNSSSNNVDSSIAINTNWNNVKLQLKPSSGLMWIQNNLEAVSTSNLPDVRLQPWFRQGRKLTGGTRLGHLRFMEAYNT